MRKIAIDAEYKRVERVKKRVGRPRFYWLQVTMKRAYRFIRKKGGKRNKKFDPLGKGKRKSGEGGKLTSFPF